MNRNNNCLRLVVLLLMANAGLVSPAGAAGSRLAGAGSDMAMTGYDKNVVYKNRPAIHSDCRRNGVVWSGGIARRGPDRISPRPVRSRWQRGDESRIYCAGGDPFSQQRVADQSWIR